MTYGLDTSFLVAAEVVAHPQYAPARATLRQLARQGERIGVAPQVIAEFVHVVTDPRRFDPALAVAAALDRARAWWQTPQVERVVPDDAALTVFFEWMAQLRLGRKRLLDTLLAATFHAAGIANVLTTDTRDFGAFGCFQIVAPGALAAES